MDRVFENGETAFNFSFDQSVAEIGISIFVLYKQNDTRTTCWWAYSLYKVMYTLSLSNEDIRVKNGHGNFHQISSEGYWTVRWTNRFWSGNSTYQTIEQVLMIMIKSRGGLAWCHTEHSIKGC